MDEDGAALAAITHGHPLGYLPAAILTHIISLGVYGRDGLTLREAVDEAWSTVSGLFKTRVPDTGGIFGSAGEKGHILTGLKATCL